MPDENIRELIATKLAIKPPVSKDGVQLDRDQLNTNYSDGSRRQDVVSVNVIFRAPSPSTNPTNPQTFKGQLDQFNHDIGKESEDNSGMIPMLYKGFHQCLLYGKILTIDLDLTNDTTFNMYTEEATTGNTAVDFKKKLASRNVWLIEAHQKTGDKTLYISHETYDSLDEQTKKLYNVNSVLLLKDELPKVDTVSTGNVNAENPEVAVGIDFGIPFSAELMTTLTSKLTKYLNDHSTPNTMTIKNAIRNNSVIIFNAKAVLVGKAEGWGIINSNLVLISSIVDNLRQSSIAIHEALHSLGLRHTFSPSITVKDKIYYFNNKRHTDNIMAYSGNHAGFTWHWQWESVKVYSDEHLKDLYPHLP